MVASEAVPWAKTGGLADVLGALPRALESLGHSVTTVLPKYRAVDVSGTETIHHRIPQGAREVDIAYHVATSSAGRRTVFVECPQYFDRTELYGERGQDYADNAERFDALAIAALDYAQLSPEKSIDVVHGHDWQTGTMLARLRIDERWPAVARAALVLTIHNLAYQGVFPRDTVPALGLPWSAFKLETGEFWGKFSFLKAGIAAAECVTTVSPTYADETRTPAHGAGLDGVLKSLGSRYSGILNGIDTDVWNPATDPLIPARFDAGDLSGKAECKRALLSRFSLPRGDDAMERPAVAMISRLVSQKGLDLVTASATEMADCNASWIFLGTGERRYEQALTELATAHPTRVAVHLGFDEALAHLIEAGADIFLMPSLFEPCGLNQMYSLRYGTVPVVRAVGGLDDTVRPYTARAKHANGFKFQSASPADFMQVVRRALRLYRDKPVWRQLMANGMAADHSWTTSAREYVKVYRRARSWHNAGFRTAFSDR